MYVKMSFCFYVASHLVFLNFLNKLFLFFLVGLKKSFLVCHFSVSNFMVLQCWLKRGGGGGGGGGGVGGGEAWRRATRNDRNSRESSDILSSLASICL